MSPKLRVVPLTPAPGRNHSQRVSRTRTGERLRDDEPTQVAPLSYGSAPPPRGGASNAPDAPDAQSPRVSRITRAPAQREEIGAHYHMRNPEHGTTSVLPPARSTPPSRPPSIPAAAFAEADAYFEAAELLLQRGDTRAAVLTAQKAMKLAPPRPAQQALYGWLLYERDGRANPIHPHVFRHLDQALFRDPNCVDALCFKGVLYAAAGQTTEARAHLRRALELEPDNRAAARALERLDQ